MHPKVRQCPKVLLEVAGVPLLTRQLIRLRDEMGIRDVTIIVGHMASDIRDAYGDGSSIGMSIQFVENTNVDRGLGTALFAIEGLIDEPFVFLLGDEFYLGSNHSDLSWPGGDAIAICAVKHTEDPEDVRRNYAVDIQGDRVVGLKEKPAVGSRGALGCGTYAFSPEIFEFAHRTEVSRETGRLELTDIIDTAAKATGEVHVFELVGEYRNVNSVDDLSHASFIQRASSLETTRISVVIPAWNEADSIGFVVDDFLPHVDEVVVMDNVSSDGTGAAAAARGARVCSRPFKGYGDAIRQGLREAEGDLLVVVEADSTFRARDLGKFLQYLRDADMVIGTRTTRQLIEQGANMEGLLRWGNVLVGKLVEVLWWSVEPRLTDVGCTYRAIWRDAYDKIEPWLVCDDASFSPEMMVEVLRSRLRLVEIPVGYFPRRGGESKHSSSLKHSIGTGLKMLKVILSRRLGLR